MELSKKIFYETKSKSYKSEDRLLTQSEVKTQERLTEEKPAAKPQEKMELAMARGMLGWA